MDSPAQLAHRLRTSVGRLVRATRSVDRMSPTVGAVLDLLGRHGAMTVADLAACRGVRHQSMAVSVEELLANGYVERRPHPVDGRKKLVDVTALGREALESESSRRECALAEAIAGTLERQEFAELARGLDLIDVLVESLGDTRGGDLAGQVLSGSW